MTLRQPSHVLILSEPVPPLHPGGAGKLAFDLAVGLAAQGLEIDIVCVSESVRAVERRAGVDIHWIEAPEFGWSARTFEVRHDRVLASLRRLHAERPYDLVHDIGGFLYAHPFRSFVLSSGVPGITHLLLLMGPYLSEARVPQQWIEFFHQQQLLQCGVSDAVVTTSRADSLLYRGLVSDAPMDRIIWNAIDVPAPDPIRVQYFRAALRSSEDDLLLYFGGLPSDRAKGGDRAMALAACLAGRGYRPRILVTNLRGRDTPTSGACPVVNLGRLSSADLVAVLAAADLVVCPSRYEAFGLLAAEAGALGTPVLAAAVGGHLDTISTLVPGRLVDDEEWSDPGPALLDYIREASRRNHERISIRIPDELRLDTLAQRVKQTYREVLADV